MMFKSVILAFVFTLFFVFPAWAQTSADANDVIATITEVEGTGAVAVAGDSGSSTAAAVNMNLHMNDTVTTGADSRISILFIDDTEITLGDNAQLRIDEYAFNPDDSSDNGAVYNFLRGTFLYVSGMIAKKPDPDVLLNTPYGSIGIRGTTVWGGDMDDEYGVLVQEGEVTVNPAANATWKAPLRLHQGEGAGIGGKRFSGNPEVKTWKAEKIEQAKKKVHLKNEQAVRQRMAEIKTRHPEMVRKHKEMQQQRREKTQDLKEKRENIHQELQKNKIEKKSDAMPHTPAPAQRQEYLQKMEQKRLQQRNHVAPPAGR